MDQSEVYASLYVNTYTQSLDFIQSALAFEHKLVSKAPKTRKDAYKTLISTGLKFKDYGISELSTFGKGLKVLGRVNALHSVYAEFKKASDMGKLQGEGLNYSLVVAMFDEHRSQADWVIETIVVAQSKGLITGDKQYIEQFANFALSGELPTVKSENSKISFVIDSSLKEKLESDFSVLKNFVETDSEKVGTVDLGDQKKVVHDLRELSIKPRGTNEIKD